MGLVAQKSAVLLGGAAMAIVIGVTGVSAQQAAETTTTTTAKQNRVTLLQRLVVGAGAEKIALDTPQAVTVLDQDDIDREQATTMGDLLRDVPGATMVGSDRVFGEAFNIRGIGATDNSADGSRIVVTVDGAPKFNEQYRMGSFFSDPELYKKVEILRGPASSTLYGSGALGGVVNFVTKDASDFIADGETGAVRLKGTYTSNGDGGLASVLWAHRFGEATELLATGNFRRSDAFKLANGNLLTGSEFESWSGLIKGTHYIDNEQVVRLSYQRWQSAGNNQDYAQTGTQPMFGFIDRDVSDDTVVLSYENDASDNPWLDLNVSLSYSNTANSQKNYRPGNPPLPLPPIGDTGNTAILRDTDYGYRTWQLKADNTFDLIGDSYENFLTVGVQASHQDRIAGRPGGSAALQQHPEGSEQKLGLFAQNEFIWDKHLTIIAGTRVDFHTMQPKGSIPGSRAINGSAFSPKIAAMYDFNDSFGIFGSIAHTERFPTLDELFTYGGGKTLSLNLEKESSNNYELGFKTSAYDIGGGSNTVSLKTTGFYNNIDNMIASGPAGGAYFVNINKARIYGVEVEGSYESDLFFARLAYAYIKGENRETGAALTTVPQNTLAFTLGSRYEPWSLEYGVRATIADKGDYVLASANPRNPFGGDGEATAWNSVDLFATWKPQEGQFKGWEAQFGVENLFNEDYRRNLAQDRSKGRTFKVTLAKQFGY